MIPRIQHRLLAAGACLFLARGLIVADDASGPQPPSPPRLSQPALTAQPAFTAQQPSPHFFPGRLLRSKLIEMPEPPAPPSIQQPTADLRPPTADLASPTADLRPPTSDFASPTPDLRSPTSDLASPTSDLRPPTSALEPSFERPVLEARASPHFFFGHARLQMPLRRAPGPDILATDTRVADIPVCHEPPSQSETTGSAAVANSEPPKTAVEAPANRPRPTLAIAAESIESPATLDKASTAASPPAQLQSTTLQPAPKPAFTAQPHKILASLPQRQSTEKQASFASLKPAAVQPVAAQQAGPVQERLARLGGSAAPLQPAEVFSVPRPDFFAEEIEATGLQARLPQPSSSTQLSSTPQSGDAPRLAAVPQASSQSPAPQPATISSADAVPAVASREITESQFRLAALQQPLPGPYSPLQPAEVLPIPIPDSPAAPRIPTLDQDRPIAALTTNIAPPSGRLPTDLAADHFRGDYPPWASRGYSELVYFWDAPALCYGPLRFEEVNLERYGYGCCHALQPFVSAAHFTGALFALPYNMVNRPCWECIYPLGHYRPGSPVPYRKIWPEWNPLAASAECATIAGLILLIP